MGVVDPAALVGSFKRYKRNYQRQLSTSARPTLSQCTMDKGQALVRVNVNSTKKKTTALQVETATSSANTLDEEIVPLPPACLKSKIKNSRQIYGSSYSTIRCSAQIRNSFLK